MAVRETEFRAAPGHELCLAAVTILLARNCPYFKEGMAVGDSSCTLLGTCKVWGGVQEIALIEKWGGGFESSRLGRKMERKHLELSLLLPYLLLALALWCEQKRQNLIRGRAS